MPMVNRQQQLCNDGERVLYREWRTSQHSVLITRPVAEQPTPGCLDRLLHEFNLKDELDSAWAVRPIELVREAGKSFLHLDDPGGEPLSRLLVAPMETSDFLSVAIDVAVALGRLHQCALVHKDLKPAHILVNCNDGHARLTGFGLTSRLPRERQAPKPLETIAGTLAYMAPEQTGRMNRSIDSRSDLYSFGVVLYQMLTGSLPFTATDAMEWVHCHIAKRPVPPSVRVETVPAVLSQIVMKLLAKTAEDRYQTAGGIEQDLRHCQADWLAHQRINDFALDTQGSSGRLLIPEKLYGRELVVESLVNAFNRVVSQGVPELVLVSGYSGIGKSSVVNELHKVLVPPRGLFASGKFDQYKRDIPYSTLVQAFQSLVHALLGKSEADLASWRDKLLGALEPNARLMTDLIPELKLIIGEPQAVPELEPQQAQRRFMLVFQRFIGVFAQPEHPLALFLDDLQWLDIATLDLLESLLVQSDLRQLMLIGAYRDNEVDATHPLTAKLQAIGHAGVSIEQVMLLPLTATHIEQLISESLHCPSGQITTLAQLVFEKTAGNPFFVIQFLQALVEGNLLCFDHRQSNWIWDPRRIHAMGYTDNVVDLMVNKLTRLPMETQQALQQLACLGNVAEIATLATVLGISQVQVHRVLWQAVRQELVERSGEGYGFVHDRIHEAAYSLTPVESRAEAHLRIGRLLAAQTLPGQQEEAIFEIVGQLNRGATLISGQQEREQLASLNLLAGLRAKASTAYASALTYLCAGIDLLGADCWAHQHELSYGLELNRAECEFLTGQLVAADTYLQTLMNHAATTVERGQVTCLQMDVYLLLDRSDRAVAVCLDYLRYVDIDWSAHPNDKEVRREYDHIWLRLGDRAIEDLIDLPLMEDAASLVTLDALSKLFAPALQSDANLASLTICKAVSLSLERGNCDASCVLYANVGRVAGRRFGDYKAGLRFGQLGCDLVERRGLKRFEASTYLCFSIFIARWMKPVRECRDLLRQAFVAANRVGDLAYGAYAGNALNSDLIFSGERLFDVQSEAERGLAYAKKVKFGLVTDFISTQLALVRMLRGLTPSFGCFDSDQFNERNTEEHLCASPDLALATCWYWIRKLQSHYLAEDNVAALSAAAKAQPLLWVASSFYEEAEYFFYAALAMAAVYDDASRSERLQFLRSMAEYHLQLQTWAQQCPENFAAQVSLVAAELARCEGRIVDAELLYEQTIGFAQQNAFVHIEALANELAARFYAGRGLQKVARVYMQDARYAYLRWGADGKVRQLDEKYPYLRTETPRLGPTTTIAAPVEHLDLATVLKVAQAASSELVLEKLIDRVMRTAIEQAGAERGLLILSSDDDLRIAAEATASDETTQMLLRDAPVSAALLSGSILNQVLRTRQHLCLDDAVTELQFAGDAYIREYRARSILCLPLMNQAKLIGALYLENNLAANVFSPARIAVLTLLASQAAISLDNARLYRDVEQREAKIRRLVDANIIGIIVWNTNGEIIEANDAFLRMVGYEREELVSGRVGWRDLTTPESQVESELALALAIQTGHVQPFEKQYIKKDGSVLSVILGLASFEASRNEGVAFVLDLTERKLAEQKAREGERRYREVQAELAHANRVATMGQLAASIAHEVNQPIAATVTNAETALRWLHFNPPELGEVEQVLGRIVNDANRAAEVLSRIRGLIKKAPPQKTLVDINIAVSEMIDFTRGQASKSGALVQAQLTDGLPLITGDRVELQQVLLNLIINALEAMSAVIDGVRVLQVISGRDDSGCLLVTVRDSGPGFAEKNAEHAFAPFYTTKSTGLGMGLSICRSIIDAHGGRLWASANLPRGAVVQFTLPIASNAPAL
ncbi:trifunctional serine/threonine-protein kinase/ATP-binding protein/sensor histidine kinase [Pseudomonas sp. EL_65y_Pfl2_R95]|uniref:trifunctional serine/threonine-protein kinase/ATP-binding protein/sensor histidine kinase n=1 Tax=Pseudomonas sp. EL_65y_Pfl2_R95 TaxID=3088698 RepID=UPI0030D84FCC